MIGHLHCDGGETDIGLCRGDFDKSTCNDDVVALDCTGIEMFVFSNMIRENLIELYIIIFRLS